MHEQLKKNSLFKHLNTEQLTERIDSAPKRIIHYKKGELIQDYPNEMGIVLKGKIEVQKNLYTGKKVIMNQLREGSLFGIASLFQNNNYKMTTLLAKSDTTALFIEEDFLLHWFHQEPIFLKNYLAYMNQRIYFLNQRIECFAHEQIRDRFIEFLEQQRVQQQNPQQVDLFLSKSELADYLAISRASLYRIITTLELEGYIRVKKNKVFFCNPVAK